MGKAVRNVSSGVAFQPDDVQAMSAALEEVCEELKIRRHETAREIVAIRIIELASRGERDPAKLRDELLGDAHGGTGC